MGIGQIPGITPIGGMRTEQIDAQMPTVFHIEGSAKAGDDKGQEKRRQNASPEAAADDEMMEQEAGEARLDVAPDENEPRNVDYFA